jgi:hypothetical protein
MLLFHRHIGDSNPDCESEVWPVRPAGARLSARTFTLLETAD